MGASEQAQRGTSGTAEIAGDAARRADAEPSAALLAELADADARLEGTSPTTVISWAFERFGDEGVVLTSSFQDCVLMDLAARVHPSLRVVFLDTGFHFEETLQYVETVKAHLHIEVDIITSGLQPDQSPCGTPECCQLRKVRPLAKVLEGRDAWLTGVKRVDTKERASAAVVAWDAAKHVVKVNPIVSWTEADVEGYVESRGLPRHPLNALGYRSIGCAPTTLPVEDGADPRAGRWAGSSKSECGLHL